MIDDNQIAEKQQQSSRVIGRPFPPGVSGNPAGRPKKGTAMTDIMRAMMDDKPDIAKAIMVKLLQMAAEGDITAIREVLDRLEGKPMQENRTHIIEDLALSYGYKKHNQPPTETGASVGDAAEPKV